MDRNQKEPFWLFFEVLFLALFVELVIVTAILPGRRPRLASQQWTEAPLYRLEFESVIDFSKLKFVNSSLISGFKYGSLSSTRL